MGPRFYILFMLFVVKWTKILKKRRKAMNGMKTGRLTWRQRGWLWMRLGIRLLLAVLGLALLRWLVPPLLSLFAPFLLALVVAILLNPAVKWLQRRVGLSRQTLALALVLLLFGSVGAAVGLLAYAAGNEAAMLLQNWNGLLAGLQGVLDQIEALFARLWTMVPPELNQWVESVLDGLVDWLGTATPALLNGVLDYTKDKAMGLPSFVVALVIFVMATYFLTADYPYLRMRAAQNMDAALLRFLGQVRTVALGAFGGYLKAQVLLSVGVFFILLGGFLLIRQPYSLLLALGLAVLDFIPIVGSGTVMVPWAVIELLARDFRGAVQIMVIWGLVALFRRMMEPKFVGDQTGLSPILSLVSIYVGMKVAGVMGMIFAPILVLVLLNLAGMGMFRGVRLDLAAAAEDVAAILAQRPEDQGPN